MAFGKTAATIIIGASLAASYGSTFTKAEKPAVKLGQAFQKTNKKLAAVSSVIKYKKHLTDLRTKQDTTGHSSKRLAAGITAVTAKYKKAKREAKSYGIEIGKIAREQRKLARQSKIQGMGAKGLNQFKAGKDHIKSNAISTVAEVSALALPVKVAADFQKSMSTVKALTGATDKEFKLLTASARQLGRETVFSAVEASEGMGYLGMAGFKTNEIIATMPGLLDLAAAGSTELGETADISSSILRGFGLEASEMTRVGDVLTKTFTSSNTNLQQLGEGMKYVAPIASSLGVSLEETAGMMGFLGDAGIQGSMAGTTFRKMLNSLTAPSSEGASVMQDLNIETRDYAGNLRPLGAIMKDFTAATADMGNAQKGAAIKTVFGERAMVGMMRVLSKGNTEKLKKFTEALKNSAGTAKKIAAVKLDNFHGDLKLIGSVLTDIGISLGNALLPPLRAVMVVVGFVLAPVAWALTACPLLTKVIVGLATGMIFSLKVLPLLKAGLLLVSGGIKVLTASIMMNPIGLIIAAIAVAVMLVIEYWTPICGFFKSIWNGIVSIFSWGWKWIKTIFLYTSPLGIIIANWEPICGVFKSIWDGIVSIFSWGWEWIKTIFLYTSPIGIIIANWEPIKSFFAGIWDFIVGGAKTAFDWILNKINFVGSAWKTVKGWFGFGSDEEETKTDIKPSSKNAAVNPRAQAALEQARASSPAMQAAKAGSQKNINNNQAITINTLPGQNSEEIAEMVLRKQQELDEDKRQGGLYDNELSYA